MYTAYGITADGQRVPLAVERAVSTTGLVIPSVVTGGQVFERVVVDVASDPPPPWNGPGGMSTIEDFSGADGTLGADEAGWEPVTSSLIAEPPPAEPSITFLADDRTPIVTLKVAGGRLVADYDPERLDDAARALVERALGMYGGVADPGPDCSYPGCTAMMQQEMIYFDLAYDGGRCERHR